MNIEKIKNFSKDEQETLEYFEQIKNVILEKENNDELDEGVEFIFGRKFTSEIDILLNLVITLQEDKEELQKEYKYLGEENQRINKFEIELLQKILEGDN